MNADGRYQVQYLIVSKSYSDDKYLSENEL